MKHRPRTAQTRLLGQINHAYNKTTHMGLQPFAWQLEQDLGPEYKKLNRPLIATLYQKCKQGGLTINDAV